MLQVQAAQLIASCNPRLRPYQCQPDSNSDFRAWPAVNADLIMADMLQQRLQQLDAEIAVLQPQIVTAQADYLAANAESSTKFKHVLDQLVEEKQALIRSRDKLLDKLPGAQPGRAVCCFGLAECCA